MALDFSQFAEVINTMSQNPELEVQQDQVQDQSLPHLAIDGQAELEAIKAKQKMTETSKTKAHKNKKVERSKGHFDKLSISQNKGKKKSHK